MNYHRSRSLEKIRQTRSRLLRTHAAAQPASSVGRVVALYAFQEGSARIQFLASCLLPSATTNTKLALPYINLNVALACCCLGFNVNRSQCSARKLLVSAT